MIKSKLHGPGKLIKESDVHGKQAAMTLSKTRKKKEP